MNCKQPCLHAIVPQEGNGFGDSQLPRCASDLEASSPTQALLSVFIFSTSAGTDCLASCSNHLSADEEYARTFGLASSRAFNSAVTIR